MARWTLRHSTDLVLRCDQWNRSCPLPLVLAPTGPMKVAGGKARPQGETHPPVTRSKKPRAPAGRMIKVPTANPMRPARARARRPPVRWVRLVSPSFPPATFMRASSAKRLTGLFPPKTAKNHHNAVKELLERVLCMIGSVFLLDRHLHPRQPDAGVHPGIGPREAGHGNLWLQRWLALGDVLRLENLPALGRVPGLQASAFAGLLVEGAIHAQANAPRWIRRYRVFMVLFMHHENEGGRRPGLAGSRQVQPSGSG